MASQLNNWNNSKKVGGVVEDIVCEALNALGHAFVKNNDEILTDIDLTDGQLLLDVKCAFTPYPNEMTPAGLTKAEHLTLDVANIKKYPAIALIIFAVCYPDTSGLYVITAGACQRLLTEQPKRIYSRRMRTLKDKVRKLGVSLKECQHIPVHNSYIERIKEVAQKAEK